MTAPAVTSISFSEDIVRRISFKIQFNKQTFPSYFVKTSPTSNSLLWPRFANAALNRVHNSFVLMLVLERRLSGHLHSVRRNRSGRGLERSKRFVEFRCPFPLLHAFS
jgi:hypothetical protein